MANPYRDIVALLKELGPTRSSRLTQSLINSGSSHIAAKQRVSRATRSNAISRTVGLNLAHGEAFLYLEEQAKLPVFIERLWQVLQETNSIAAAGIHGIAGRGGVVSQGHFAGVIGAPSRIKGHIPYSSLQLFLEVNQLILRRSLDGFGDFFELSQHLPFNVSTPARLRAQLLAENIVLNHLTRWFELIGMTGYDRSQIRSDQSQPDFAQFYWDAVALSAVSPMRTREPDGKFAPGFVVADITLHGTLEYEQVQSFIRKCEITRNQKRQRPFLSMLIAENFTKPAFNALRQYGCMAATLHNLLGEGLARALSDLVSVLTEAAKAVKSSPDIVFELFNKLAAIEGAAANLRGPLFELIVAQSVAREGGEVDIQRILYDAGGKSLTDIDVLRTKKGVEVVAYECKGHLGTNRVDVMEVQKWCEETVPKIRAFFNQNEQFYRGLRHRFEFWTTGSIDGEAVDYLSKRKGEIKKYEIDWKAGHQVLNYVKQLRVGTLDQVLQEHYLRHPLVKTLSRLARSSTPSPVQNEQVHDAEQVSDLIPNLIRRHDGAP